MAKRARGSTIRPGQRARLQRGPSAPKPAGTAATTPAAAPPPPTLTPEEEARAAALEAQIVADEKAAESAAKTRTLGRRSAVSEPIARPSSIAAAAAHEYDYVARDLRRIAIIGGGLIVLLLLLWVVVAVTGIGPL